MSKKSRFFSIVLAFVMAFSLTSISVLAAEPVSKKITIFHTNDEHGRFVKADNVIGISTIATIKAETKNSLLISAGDSFHGLPFATLNQGADVVELMNMAGYDYTAPGNHDFNYGYKRLLELSEMAKFKILAANVQKDGQNILSATSMKTIDGISVGFFGLATPETLYKTSPKNVEGLEFTDVVAAANKCVDILKDRGAEVVVGVFHLGTDESSVDTSEKVATYVRSIDVVIDGHSHTLFNEGKMVGQTLIASAGQYEGNVGKVELTFQNNKLISKKASMIDAKTAAATYKPNEEIDKKIEEINKAQGKVLNVEVGSISTTLSSARAPGVRTQEMALGNLVADALKYATGADIALTNGGGLRADIKEGKITKKDIIAVLPFGNYGVTKYITPAQLKEMLENGVSKAPSADGRFPHISGFTFTYDQSKPVGSRVTEILVNGKSVDFADNTTKLLLATNDFTAVGGDEYTTLKSVKTETEFGALEELVTDYIKSPAYKEPKVEGRIKAVAKVSALTKAFNKAA